MKVFTVSELTYAIKQLLEPTFRGISLKGEISNFKRQSSGHLYFSLKDTDCQISAAMFRMDAGSLSREPKEGDQVIVQGTLSLYAPRGSYQIIVRTLQFLGQGELLLKLQELKERLKDRGFFDVQRKKPIPKFPKKIGIVTSPTGAVIQDILHVLHRRFSGFHVILNPVKVQGEGAAKEIAQAITDFNRFQLVDVIIVGRGGGSIEDLWAFNEEMVAQAIFESSIPIISAVGHETDVTIADFVADVRAPTPSAAAEIATAEKENVLKHLKQMRQFFDQKMGTLLSQGKQRLKALQKHPFLSSPSMLLSQPMQKLDDYREALDKACFRSISEKKLKLQILSKGLQLLQPSAQILSLKQLLSRYPQ